MTEVIAEEPPKKSGAKGLIVLLAVIVLAGGGGFAAGMMGLVPIPMGHPAPDAKHDPHHDVAAVSDMVPTFHALPDLTIPLGKGSSAQYLRAKLQLETDAEHADAVRQSEPRIVDTLNIFLRAIDERDVASILAMEKLRAEMLRRVRLVTGEEAVHSVLIGEFLLR
jgi:flagellar protein FliL